MKKKNKIYIKNYTYPSAPSVALCELEIVGPSEIAVAPRHYGSHLGTSPPHPPPCRPVGEERKKNQLRRGEGGQTQKKKQKKSNLLLKKSVLLRRLEL
jgi:hypothetical protein